jgi:hypothetical protein
MCCSGLKPLHKRPEYVLQRFETVAINETKKQNFQPVLQRFETAAIFYFIF